MRPLSNLALDLSGRSASGAGFVAAGCLLCGRQVSANVRQPISSQVTLAYGTVEPWVTRLTSSSLKP